MAGVRTVTVLGATGKLGPHVVRGLCDAGFEVTAAGRNTARLAALDRRSTTVRVDLERPATIRAADAVVTLAPHWLLDRVLGALPGDARLIAAGSIRRYSRLADPVAESARRAETLLKQTRCRWLLLNFSLVYGPGDATVSRVLAAMRRWPRWCPAVVPLPDGGGATVQPLFIDDAVAAVIAALNRPEVAERSIDVAGPEPIRYADLLRACARAAGRTVYILPLPAAPMIAAARMLPLPVSADEIARACESKSVDVTAMRRLLDIHPIAFETGLARIAGAP